MMVSPKLSKTTRDIVSSFWSISPFLLYFSTDTTRFRYHLWCNWDVSKAVGRTSLTKFMNYKLKVRRPARHFAGERDPIFRSGQSSLLYSCTLLFAEAPSPSRPLLIPGFSGVYPSAAVSGEHVPCLGPLKHFRGKALILAEKFEFLIKPFVMFAKYKGFPGKGMHPWGGSNRDPVKWAAAMGVQRSSHINKYGASLVVSHEGDLYDHVQAALVAPHPLDEDVTLPTDLEFGIFLLEHLKIGITPWRAKQLYGWAQLREACKPLDEEIRRVIPEYLRPVTSKVSSTSNISKNPTKNN